VLFDKTASVYFISVFNILALEMASQGNRRHCANCIGALSIPTEHFTAPE